MYSITVLCVGKLKEKFYIAAVEEYQKRLRGLCRLDIVELAEERLPDAPSPAQIQAALEKESRRILAKIPANAALIALCVEGTLLSSEELAKKIAAFGSAGRSSLCFVIGGSYGLHPTVKEAAQLRLSMSPMTFPHHLARVMVLEQVYRAFQINAGTKYHK
ncbi:MAG: 23S rRNA (pseudouridine(1915)-N(3))-methyltransferase RlmH [Clostridiales bacterium]|nr:23S rRNA (pseudouridine(1915)-N(3))-methyltransferase RlmH [Clostridiales bacterium]